MEFKFKFSDNVKVVNGFYKGEDGVVRSYKGGDDGIIFYRVERRPTYIGSSFDEWINGEDLEKVSR